MLDQNKTIDSSKTRTLLKDYTNALRQQLFFWGQDVLHPNGNLLCKFGLERLKHEDSDNRSSCYRMDYKGGVIELHGLCVGLYSSEQQSFFFTRTPLRSCIYKSSTPPIPGVFKKELIKTKPVAEIATSSRQFLEWWLEYESWIAMDTEPGYRNQCYKRFRMLPSSKSWLPPKKALEWLQCYMNSPEDLKRVREWKKYN